MKNKKLKTGIFLGMLLLLGATSMQAQSKMTQNHKPPTFEQLLEKMDANEDGKLSQDEVKGPLKDDFARVDEDEDGFITEAELKKAPRPDRKKKPKNN